VNGFDKHMTSSTEYLSKDDTTAHGPAAAQWESEHLVRTRTISHDAIPCFFLSATLDTDPSASDRSLGCLDARALCGCKNALM
jgi:hypothetical protein